MFLCRIYASILVCHLSCFLSVFCIYQRLFIKICKSLVFGFCFFEVLLQTPLTVLILGRSTLQATTLVPIRASIRVGRCLDPSAKRFVACTGGTGDMPRPCWAVAGGEPHQTINHDYSPTSKSKHFSYT